MLGKTVDNYLAIDLAPEAVRVLDVVIRRGQTTVSSIASGALSEGQNASLPERHLAALESLISQHRMRGRQCVAAVPTSLVTTRSVMIDPSRPQSPEEQIRMTLQNILSFDQRDLLFDFWDIGDANGKNRTYEVLVVATQRSVVHKYLNGFKKLRLNCTHMDVAPCAIATLLGKLAPQQDSMVGTIALGESLGYFAVVDKQRVLFWRPFEMPSPKNGAQAGLERVGDEISKCVSHMVGSVHFDSMSELFVFGEASQDPGFSCYLTTRFNLQVRTPSPFESLGADAIPADIRAALQPAAASHYATALGLALQPAGGNNG